LDDSMAASSGVLTAAKKADKTGDWMAASKAAPKADLTVSRWVDSTAERRAAQKAAR